MDHCDEREDDATNSILEDDDQRLLHDGDMYPCHCDEHEDDTTYRILDDDDQRLLHDLVQKYGHSSVEQFLSNMKMTDPSTRKYLNTND